MTTTPPGGRLTSLSRSISGKRAIVTGAASGMGRATAQLFADEGARVVIADLGPDRVARAVEEIEAVHGPDSALGVVCDVGDPAQLEALVEKTVAWCGGIDILVNNAGIVRVDGAFVREEEFEENWGTTLDVNLTAHARLIRFALPYLMESESPRIVNIASTEAIVSTTGLAGYAASKAGVIGLTQSLAVELGKHGITVNSICPGPIRTPMTENFSDEVKSVYAHRRVPLRRYAEPEEVAQMTLSLVLPAASFVSGVALPVDGGMTIRHT
jgi:3-oxoacyl-[acyl-carrier protein] reductase